MNKIVGDFESRSVHLDGKHLDPKPSQKLFNHSPDGFMWGYGGSGPAQLALAILMKATGNNDVALALYQKFKWEKLATLPMEDFEMEIDIEAWIKSKGVANA